MREEEQPRGVVRRNKTDTSLSRIRKFILSQVEDGGTRSVVLHVDIKSGNIAKVRKTVTDELR